MLLHPSTAKYAQCSQFLEVLRMEGFSTQSYGCIGATTRLSDDPVSQTPDSDIEAAICSK